MSWQSEQVTSSRSFLYIFDFRKSEYCWCGLLEWISSSYRAYDQSYITDMPDGWYAITNQKMRLGFGVHFPTDVYKFLWYWQSFGGGYGYPWHGRTYNIGLEPFTSYTNEGLEVATNNGTALRLEPGERVSTSLKAVAYTDASGVERLNPDGSVVTKTD